MIIIKNILILFLLVSFLVMCKPNSKKYYFKNGSVKKEYQRIDSENVLFTEYFSSGETKIVAEMKNRKQDGKTIEYYKNGKIRRKIFFKEGVQQDSMLVYFSNGNLLEKSYIQDGVKQNNITMYREDGSKKIFAQVKDGQLEGDLFYFSKTGDLLDTISFKDNMPSNWNNFKNNEFSVVYPNHWKEYQDRQPGVVLLAYDYLSSSEYSTSLNIVRLETPDSLTKMNSMTFIIDDLKNTFPSFKIIEKSETQMEFEVVNNGMSTRNICGVKMSRSEYFVLSLSGSVDDFELNKFIFELIFDSFSDAVSPAPRHMINK